MKNLLDMARRLGAEEPSPGEEEAEVGADGVEGWRRLFSSLSGLAGPEVLTGRFGTRGPPPSSTQVCHFYHTLSQFYQTFKIFTVIICESWRSQGKIPSGEVDHDKVCDPVDHSDLTFVLAGPGHSGSTWLGHALRATGEIYITHEINYLTWTKKREPLDRFFLDVQGARILGEHSNNYFSWDGIPEQLCKLNSDLKIIIMVRDPVQKLISNYLHDIRWGILPRYVSLEIAILPNYFERRYVHDSDYVLNIKKWLGFFPAKNIYLFRSPADTKSGSQLSHLLQFLGANEKVCEPDMRKVNQTVIPYFPQVHRHAKFGEPGIARAFYRAIEPLNIAAGKFKSKPVTDLDVSAVRDRLGERATLSELRRIAKSEGIPGQDWL